VDVAVSAAAGQPGLPPPAAATSGNQASPAQ